MSIIVRPALPSDEPFIVESWKNSYRTAAAVRLCDREHYRLEMDRMIRRLCARCTVRVACNSDDLDQLVGFAAFTDGELHYVYVKLDFRRGGIARQLLRDVPIKSYTFLSVCAQPNKHKGWVFTPRFTI